MGNIMRQPAGVMARGCWLIELLPALHTEQDPRMEDKSGGTFFEDISSLLVNVRLRQKIQIEEEREKDETERETQAYLSVATVTFRHNYNCYCYIEYFNFCEEKTLYFPQNYLIDYTKFKVHPQLQSCPSCSASKTFNE